VSWTKLRSQGPDRLLQCDTKSGAAARSPFVAETAGAPTKDSLSERATDHSGGLTAANERLALRE
jgi:hypothetical protein